MSFRECMANAEKDGDITPQQAIEVRDLFDAVRGSLAADLGGQAAETAAARETFMRLKADVAHRKRVKVLGMQAFRARQKDMAAYSRPDRPGAALAGMISPDSATRAASLEMVERGVQKELFSQLDDLLYEFRRTVTGGSRNETLMRDVVREIFGENSGNVAARELATSWQKVSDYARLRANTAGMRIAKRQNWGLPQSHNAVAIRAAGKQAWIDEILPSLDMVKMRSERTDLPFSEQTLRAALSDVYDSIATNGFNKLAPGSALRGRALHNRHTDHRFLVFKDADSWANYQAKYGNADTFDVMVGHLRNSAREISQLEMFGPNPESTVAALRDYARKVAAESGNEKAMANVEGDLVKFNQMWSLATKGDETSSQHWATIGSGTRNIISAALLGGAPITALADFNTQRIAASFLGMPTGKLMTRIFSEMAQGKDAGRFAARMGLVSDAWLNVGSANARFFGDSMLPGVTRRIADTTHRMSGLTGITRAGRQAFGLELQGYLGDNVGKSFVKLHEGLQQIMQRNGISAAEWDVIRKTPLFKHQGATFLRVLDVADRTDLPKRTARDLANKAMAMVESEMDIAVPIATTRARLVFTGNTARGTAAGEIVRFAGMFKTFPVTLMLRNIGRLLDQPTTTSKVRWVGDFLITSTLIGAGIVQTKQILAGRDPRPIDNFEFWLAGLLQGGGLGILGDFLFTNVNRFGKGFGTTIAGPGASLGTDAVNLTAGNLVQLLSGEETDFGIELTDFVARYTPGASIWYLRTALERLVTDQVRQLVDPDADKKLRRKMRQWERDFDQGHWWERGKMAPERAPDFANALGN